MTPERWERVKELFHSALEQPATQRNEFLEQACGGDTELLKEVRSLLASSNEDDAFLERPAAELLGLPREAPAHADERIGPYRVVAEIGRGGMGVVYQAERADDQFRKRVAIKVIKRGMDSDLILQRFRQERQILASLDHPNIASLLDGGVTADGLPYLVMELVEGEPIVAHVASRKLPLRARIELFRDVCAAVHFAHQNLVVHRDLKPSNVLVTADGSVKLLDFGVAKLLRSHAEFTAPETRLGDRILTPAYASPEQMRGEQVTTATDVYSLGIILYELLTERRPFDLESRSLEDAARVVSSEMPEAPSAAARERPHDISPGGNVRAQLRLTRELDNIVLMAIRKEAPRRYASAAALSEDLARYLEGRPVLAQKDTAAYRIRKFVTRHRAAAAGAALVLLTLFGGAVTTLWQARRADRARATAEQRFEDVHALTKTLIFDVHDAIEDLPGATAARAVVVERANEYLETLANQGGDDPLLLRDVAEAYVRLALVRGQPTGANRGDLSEARASLTRAFEIAEAIVDAHPNDLAAVRTLALAREKLGDVEAWTGNLADGVQHARAALTGFQLIADRQPDSTRAQLSAAISHIKLADLLGSPHFPSLGDRARAADHYTRSREILEGSLLGGSTDQNVRRYRALVYERLGSLARAESRWKEALDTYGRSLALREELAAQGGKSANALRDVAVTLQNTCEVRIQLSELTQARADCERARGLYGELREADPENIQTWEDLARIHASFSTLALANDDHATAVAELRATVSVREGMLKSHPENVVNRRLLIRALTDLVRRYVELAADEDATGTERSQARVALQRARSLEQALAAEGLATSDEQDLIAVAAKAIGG